MRLRDAVELGAPVVAAADEDAHGPRLRLEEDERALERRFLRGLRKPAVLLLERREALRDRALTGLLEVDVERRVDLEPLGLQLLAVALRELALDEVHEVRRLRPERAPRDGLERPSERTLQRRVVDLLLLAHHPEHEVAALQRARRVPQRRIDVRGLDDRGERRRLGQIEVGRLLPEIVAGRLADAGDGDRPFPAEIDLVQVRLEDLVLGVARVEDDRREPPRSPCA